MSLPPIANVLFWLFAAGSVVAGWLVFRTDSMVRAAFWLLASFAGVAGILLLLNLQFLGFILILMMGGEMAIMAVFMVMFMMNPAGLNPMTMVHQHRIAIVTGTAAFLGLAAVAFTGAFPLAPHREVENVTAELGTELLGGSMLVFQTAGVALLATMIGAIAVAGRRGRFGDAEEGSTEPTLNGAGAGPAQPQHDGGEHAGHEDQGSPG